MLIVDESHTLGNTPCDQPLSADTQKKGGKNCHRKGPTKAKYWTPGGGGGGPRKREKDKKTCKHGNKAEAAAADDDFEIAGWAAIEELLEGDDCLPEIAAINENIKKSVPFDSGA
jgi:hypothetical protein